MPLRITAGIWNIQNYGTSTANPPKFGANSVRRNQFLCRYRTRWNVQIMLLMEVSSYASADLHDLVTQLNAVATAAGLTTDWAFSFCGSAIATGARNPLVDEDDITFRSDARSEGYAVVWRTNQAAIYRMLPSLVPMAAETWAPAINPNLPVANPLNFVTTGREAATVVAENRFRALGGYTTGAVYPYRDGVLQGAWPDLAMATTSVANPHQIAWAGARRPAFVVINQTNGGTVGRRLCPIAAYHAPSNAGQASWGAYMTGLSRELYVTNNLTGGGAPDPAALVHNESAVVGGDYNLEVATAAWPGAYENYTRGFNNAWDGGANCREAPLHGAADTSRRSTVQLLHHDHVTPIAGAASTDFLRHMLDLAFTRDSTSTIRGFRMDVLDELMSDAGGARFGAVLTALNAHLDAYVTALPADGNHNVVAAGHGPERRMRVRVGGVWQWVWKPLLTGSWGSSFANWNTFKAQLAAGRLTGARQAAEYYHMFVTDHLPILVDFSW